MKAATARPTSVCPAKSGLYGGGFWTPEGSYLVLHPISASLATQAGRYLRRGGWQEGRLALGIGQRVARGVRGGSGHRIGVPGARASLACLIVRHSPRTNRHATRTPGGSGVTLVASVPRPGPTQASRCTDRPTFQARRDGYVGQPGHRGTVTLHVHPIAGRLRCWSVTAGRFRCATRRVPPT